MTVLPQTLSIRGQFHNKCWHLKCHFWMLKCLYFGTYNANYLEHCDRKLAFKCQKNGHFKTPKCIYVINAKLAKNKSRCPKTECSV